MSQPQQTRPAVARAVRATYAAFIFVGVAFASWASRIPSVSDHLDLSPSQLGLVLLAIAAGSVLAMPSSGPIVHRIGSRRTVQVMAMVNGAGLLIAGVGHQFSIVWLVVGLFFFGLGQGAWDVAMNVQGALVERRLGRSIMARFHAGFSVGTVAGALVGAAMVLLGVPVWIHLPLIAVVGVIGVPLAVRGFLPDIDPEAEAADTTPRRHPLKAWTEPRTLVIGLFVLAFAFAEGSGNDWIAKGLNDAYAMPEWVGTLGFAIFLSAMTVGRWFGPGLLDAYGRVTVSRVLSAISLVGVIIFAFGGSVGVSFAGAVLWGFGLSLGFPLGMSAGADEERYAPARVSVIASIGYCAFLGGPPLIGFLAEALGAPDGIIKAMTTVAVLLVIAILITGSVREPGGHVRGRLPGSDGQDLTAAASDPAGSELR